MKTRHIFFEITLISKKNSNVQHWVIDVLGVWSAPNNPQLHSQLIHDLIYGPSITLNHHMRNNISIDDSSTNQN